MCKRFIPKLKPVGWSTFNQVFRMPCSAPQNLSQKFALPFGNNGNLNTVKALLSPPSLLSPLSNKPLPCESKFEINPPSLLSPPLIQNSRIYQIFSIHLATLPSMLILARFGIKTVSNLRISAVKLYLDSANYGIKELKSYQIYPCHLIL